MSDEGNPTRERTGGWESRSPKRWMRSERWQCEGKMGGNDKLRRREQKHLLWGKKNVTVLFFMCWREHSPRCYGHLEPVSPSPVAVETGVNSDRQLCLDKTSSWRHVALGQLRCVSVSADTLHGEGYTLRRAHGQLLHAWTHRKIVLLALLC